MGLSPITSWQVEEEKVEMRQILFYWTRKSLQMVTEVMKLKDLFLGRKAMSNLDSVLQQRRPYSQSYSFSSSHVLK